MTGALIFHGKDRPAASVYDENVGPLAVDRMKCALIGRLENFAKTGLCKDTIALG